MNEQYNRINVWLTNTHTPEFFEDIEYYYNMTKEDLISFIYRSGTEFILNKNLDFFITRPTNNLAKVALKQDNEEIYSEMLPCKSI